jgi:hypothetical protein
VRGSRAASGARRIQTERVNSKKHEKAHDTRQTSKKKKHKNKTAHHETRDTRQYYARATSVDGTGEQNRKNNKQDQPERGGQRCRHSRRRTAGNGSINKAHWRCACVARSCAWMCARRVAIPCILVFRAWAKAAIRLFEKAPYFASRFTRLLNALMLYASDTKLHDDKHTHYSSSSALMSA